MITEMRAANAMGGKTARPCDGCLSRRARWYCGADDAFLCRACDVSVHSANQLAKRHDRVRLRSSAPWSIISSTKNDGAEAPKWHVGVTRKPRTPRNHGHKAIQGRHSENAKGNLEGGENHIHPLVPEIGNGNGYFSTDENEENSVFRVPEFKALGENKLTKHASVDFNIDDFGINVLEGDSNRRDERGEYYEQNEGGLHGFFPPVMDILELAFDVETLFGSNTGEIDHEPNKDVKLMEHVAFDNESPDNNNNDGNNNTNARAGDDLRLKIKDEEEEILADHNMIGRIDIDDIEWKLDYNFSVGEAAEEQKPDIPVKVEGDCKIDDERKNCLVLRLNYEEVIASWGIQGSPWTDGSRPDFTFEDCWPDCILLGMCPKHKWPSAGDAVGDVAPMSGQTRTTTDGEREARVSRYREKRRTRLFAKKIRYEVRKLNAEKRPRIKGRFVKRNSLVGACF